MNTCELTTAVTAIANGLAQGLTPEEAALLGSIFLQIGDTLTTISLQRTLCGKN